MRYRFVIDLTLPGDDLNAEDVRQALVDAPGLACEDVVIREAQNIGPDDRYQDWRGGPLYDYSTFSPHTGLILGTQYPVAPVDAAALGKVWQILSDGEAGKLKNTCHPMAVGQAIGPGADAGAIIARVAILRALQQRGLAAAGASPQTFEIAAAMPLEHPFTDDSEIDAFGRFFKLL